MRLKLKTYTIIPCYSIYSDGEGPLYNLFDIDVISVYVHGTEYSVFKHTAYGAVVRDRFRRRALPQHEVLDNKLPNGRGAIVSMVLSLIDNPDGRDQLLQLLLGEDSILLDHDRTLCTDHKVMIDNLSRAIALAKLLCNK